MMDLETATEPSKSIDPVIQGSIVNYTHRPSSYAKNATPKIQNLSQQHQNHHGTQIYVRPQDDPLSAPTMNSAITMPNTLKTCLLHQTIQTSTTGKSQNNRAINHKGTNTNYPPGTRLATTVLPTLALHNGTIITLQLIGHKGAEKLPNLIFPMAHTNTLPVVKPPSLNTTVQNIFAKLDHIGAYYCALMPGITSPPTPPTKMYAINTSNHQVPSSKMHIHPDLPITSQTHTTSDANDIKLCHPDSSFCLTPAVAYTCRLMHTLPPTHHATNSVHSSMMSHGHIAIQSIPTTPAPKTPITHPAGLFTDPSPHTIHKH